MPFQTYLDAYHQLVEAQAAELEWKTSVFEKRGQAIFLRQSIKVPSLISIGQGEVGHMHKSDLSGHVVLSYADAKQVIERGWGERHLLSGTRVLPLNYTLLYAPRNIGEVEVFLQIFQASIEYCKSNHVEN